LAFRWNRFPDTLNGVKRWVVVGLLAWPLANACSTNDPAVPETRSNGGDAGSPQLEVGAASNAGGAPDGGGHLPGVGGHGASSAAGAPSAGNAPVGGTDSVCEAPATCAAYCANANRDRDCTSTEGVEPCLAYCNLELDRYVPEACRPQWEAFLSCAACAEISCEQIDCPGDFGCDDPPYLIGCDGLIDAAVECAGPCIDEGEQSGSNAQGSYRSLRSHCECPAELLAGAADGEPCVAAEDCAQECCACSGSDGMFLAQQCSAGHCVGGAAVCSALEPDLVQFCNPT
jgi:hypothetical protein